jgi:redox-sensitive bicupin YhaK (pirin superfamily)
MLELPTGSAERALYAVSGTITIDGVPIDARTLAVLNADAVPRIAARERSTVMLLGGDPVGHRFAWWNFVSSRRERIEQAKQDWSAGRIPLPPDDAQEWIPLPDGT